MTGWRVLFWTSFLGLSLVFIRPYVSVGPEVASGPNFLTSWYNITLVKPGDPPILNVSGGVTNTSPVAGTPTCVLNWGSQYALVDQPFRVSLTPRETYTVAGNVAFDQPLDDYESGGFDCYGRIPNWLLLELSRPSLRLLLSLGKT